MDKVKELMKELTAMGIPWYLWPVVIPVALLAQKLFKN